MLFENCKVLYKRKYINSIIDQNTLKVFALLTYKTTIKLLQRLFLTKYFMSL